MQEDKVYFKIFLDKPIAADWHQKRRNYVLPLL